MRNATNSSGYPVEKRILCHAPSLPQFEQLRAAVHRAAVARITDEVILHDGVRCRLVARANTDELLDDLRQRYVNLIVFDLRCPDDACLAVQSSAAFRVLDALDHTEDVEDRYPFDRVLALLPGRASPAVDEVILQLGARGVGRVLRESAGTDGEAELAFARRLLDEVGRMLRARKTGKRALCCAGGGITGIFFELGALKCLDDCLADTGSEYGGVNAFDMYFGISAGAVVTGLLAAGYSVDEYMAAIAGIPGGRIPHMDLRLLRLVHVDLPSFARRARLAARTAMGSLWATISRRQAPSPESLLFDTADLIAAPFRADRFEQALREALSTPGATNDFSKLPRPLYVGATDQDTRTHVLFGDERHTDTPISLAIQASLSINPAFSATRIGDRWYEDGFVTRTSNFVDAIRRGATLVLVVDPFVPYVTRAAGFANQRGILYNMDQDVRTISYTRYETTRNWVLRKHPEVSSYTFVPANRLRRLLSVSPMDHRPYMEIWRGAYLSMHNRLKALHHRMAGDVASHGMTLDLSRATAVAERLERTKQPSFADFFPDGKLTIRQPPLCLEAKPRAPKAASAPRTSVTAPAA